MHLFKQLILSTLMVVLVLLGSVIWHPSAEGWRIELGFAAAQAQTQAGSGRPMFGGTPFVVTANIEQAQWVQRFDAVGDGLARQSADMTAEVSGRVVAVFVSAGDRVEQGDPIIQLDERAEQIALARAQLNLEDSVTRLSRVQRMAANASASEADLREAQSALRNAELQLEDARLALNRRTLEAPFSGVVSSTSVQVGHLITPQAVVARLDDRSELQIAFRIPERLLPAVAIGQEVRVTPTALQQTALVGTIVELDGRIDLPTRSLSALASIHNPDDVFRPGMSFQISIESVGETYFAVSPLAIQWRMEGAYVWALDENNRVTQVPVQIIHRRAQDVLVDGDLEAYAQVVVEGVQSLRPGAEVTTEMPGRRP